MTCRPVIESIYLLLSSSMARVTGDAHAAPLRIRGEGSDDAAAFIFVFGQIMLWSVLMLLAIDDARRTITVREMWR